MQTPRLIYFELRGRAEPIRLFLHATSTEFDDKRVTERHEWEAMKPTLPFGRLPVYDTRGMRLCESHAILRFLGRTSTTSQEAEDTMTRLDIVQEFLAESQEDLWRFNWLANYYALLEGYAENSLKSRLDRLTSCLSRSRSEGPDAWFGRTFSYVDCLAFCYLDEIDAFFPTLLRDFEELTEFHSRVASQPTISSYLESDARPPVFGMGSMGPKVDARIESGVDAVFESPWSEPINLANAADRQRRY